MIDINKPVQQGHDFVLNHDDGTQSLGTAEDFSKLKEAGVLSGIHTDPQVAPHNEQLPEVEPEAEKPKVEAEPEKVEEPKVEEPVVGLVVEKTKGRR